MSWTARLRRGVEIPTLIALLFPGQGAQQVGMGKELAARLSRRPGAPSRRPTTSSDTTSRASASRGPTTT